MDKTIEIKKKPTTEDVYSILGIKDTFFKPIIKGIDEKPIESNLVHRLIELPTSRTVKAETYYNVNYPSSPSSRHSAYINSIFDDNTFKSLIGRTFISPDSFRLVLKDNTIDKELVWQKDFSSGRSFNISLQDGTLIVKGGDLLKFDKYRESDAIAPPMLGSATFNELRDECKNSLLLQEVSHIINNRPTWGPQPIQLSKLTHYSLPDGREVLYDEEFLYDLFSKSKNDSSLDTIISQITKIGIDPQNALGDTSKDKYLWLFREFLTNVGEHGSYIYLVSGKNTRLSDYHVYDTKDIELIKRFYPDGLSDAEIILTFTTRVAEFYGIMHGSGMTHEYSSNCWLLDTGIDGTSFDIGGLKFNHNIEEAAMATLINIVILCQYFQNIFSDKPEKINLDVYKTLWDTYSYYFIQATELSNDISFKSKQKKLLNKLNQTCNRFKESIKNTAHTKFRIDNLDTHA